MFRKSHVMATAALGLGALLLATSPAAAADPEDLVQRPQQREVTAVSGDWIEHQPGYLGGKWLLFHRGENVTLTGTGYVLIRWEIEYWVHDGRVTMPSYTDREGTFRHVASGGGARMDDPYPGGEEGRTRMQRESTGEKTTLPEGEPMLWINEYYYLDGSITITNQERTKGGTAAYNLGVTPVDYDTVMSGLVGDGGESFHRGVAHDVEGDARSADTSAADASAADASAGDRGTASGENEAAGDEREAVGDENEAAGGEREAAGGEEDGPRPQAGVTDLAETGSGGWEPLITAAAAAGFVVVGGGTMLWVRGRRRAAMSTRP